MLKSSHRSRYLSRAGAVSLVAGLFACRADPPTASSSSAGGQPAAAASGSTAGPRDGRSSAGLQLLTQVARRCEVDSYKAELRCPKHEDEELARLLSKGKELSLLEAVGTIHEGLGSEDAKVRTVAAVVADRAFALGIGSEYPTPVRVSAAQFDELARRFAALSPGEAARVVPLLVHEGMLSGEQTRMFALLSASSELERVGYRHVMTYGRLAEFPRVKSRVSAGSEQALAIALDAAALMPAWSEKEREVLCPWAFPYYSDKRAQVRGAAGRALSQCDISTLERVLPIAMTQGKAGNWAPGQPSAFRGICATRARYDGSPQFCQAALALLENGVNYDKLDPGTRVDSLQTLMISEVWMMDLGVSKLVRAHLKSSEPLLAEEARRAAAKLKSIAQAGVQQLMAPSVQAGD